MADDYEIIIGHRVRSGAGSTLVVDDYYPSAARRTHRLSWSLNRTGGCEQLMFTLDRPFDDRGGVDFFRDVVLKVNGAPWWCGTVKLIRPLLAITEQIEVTCAGYAHRADEALFTWAFGRQSLKRIGGVGEIAGLVRALFDLAPFLVGSGPDEPHPLGDGLPQIDASPYLSQRLLFHNQTLWEIFPMLATLAGNFDWGVDENRTFYFRRPQLLGATQAMYAPPRVDAAAQASISAWGGGSYADERYSEPQSVPPFIDIQNAATFVIGGNVQQMEGEESSATIKNVLIVYGSPLRPADPIPQAVVTNPTSIDALKRRLQARVSAPALTAEADLIQWATQRLQLLSRPQLRSTVESPHNRSLIHPLGAVRVVGGASNIVERLQEVQYEMNDADGAILTRAVLAYDAPADDRIGDQLRQDTTLNQNVLAQDEVIFTVRERHTWPTDSSWRVVQNGATVLQA